MRAKSCRVGTTAAMLFWLATHSSLGQAEAGLPSGQSKKSPGVAAEMTKEQGFCWRVAVYGAGSDLVDQYARIFDPENYAVAMANEFKRNQYRANIERRLSERVARLSQTERYVYYSSASGTSRDASLGEYDFEKHAFPIKRPDTEFGYFNYHAAGNGFDLNPFELDHALNAADFDWFLRMGEAEGSALVKTLRNRSVTLKITYSVSSKQVLGHGRYYLVPFIHSIDVMRDRNSGRVIGSLTRDLSVPGTWLDPNTIVTGERITYWRARPRAYWSPTGLTPQKVDWLPNPEGAEYYRIVKYRNDTIVVRDYYITGELEMEGHWVPWCGHGNRCADGLFTWYYRNGFKRQEQRFRNNDEVPYCIEAFVARQAVQWDENGKCESRGTTKCPCTDQISPGRPAAVESAADSVLQSDLEHSSKAAAGTEAELIAQKADLERELERLKSQFSSEYPPVQEKERELVGVSNRLALVGKWRFEGCATYGSNGSKLGDSDCEVTYGADGSKLDILANGVSTRSTWTLDTDTLIVVQIAEKVSGEDWKTVSRAPIHYRIIELTTARLVVGVEGTPNTFSARKVE